MTTHRDSFRINKQDKKVMGVCAGIADHLDVDVTLVRVATALLILSTMPVGAILYVVTALVANDRGASRRRDTAERTRSDAAERAGDQMRDLDKRLAALESSVKDGSSALAREIEALR